MHSEHDILRVLQAVQEQSPFFMLETPRSVVLAPFGQRHFDEAIQLLNSAKTLLSLAQLKNCMVIVVTGAEINVTQCPKWIHLIQIVDIDSWPADLSYYNRLIKWGLPWLFPNIRSSIYLDSDFIMTNNNDKWWNLFSLIEQKKFIMSRHPAAQNWQHECDRIFSFKRAHNVQNVLRQKAYYEQLKLPLDIPLAESGFMGRLHQEEVQSFCMRMLQIVADFSERDQLAFPLAITLTDFKPWFLKAGEVMISASCQQASMEKGCFVELDIADRFFEMMGEHALKRLFVRSEYRPIVLNSTREKSISRKIMSWIYRKIGRKIF